MTAPIRQLGTLALRLAPSILTALAAASAALAPTGATAQGMRCGARTTVIAHLASTYGESRHSMGLQEGRGIVELFANPGTGSWTIIVTTPKGISCLVAAGEAFRATPKDEAAQDDEPA